MPKTAKLFKNGRSQAVRLPREFRFDGEEVYVEKDGNTVLLWPKQKPDWDQFFSEPSPFPKSFLSKRKDLKLQKRKLF